LPTSLSLLTSSSSSSVAAAGSSIKRSSDSELVSVIEEVRRVDTVVTTGKRLTSHFSLPSL
ncbi:hypothetical protein Dimus_028534, partial [Dionaea muscipula]